MPKYMVVVHGDGETFATFFSDVNEAEKFRMDSTVCMGWEAEVYLRTNGECGMEYQLLYS